MYKVDPKSSYHSTKKIFLYLYEMIDLTSIYYGNHFERYMSSHYALHFELIKK